MDSQGIERMVVFLEEISPVAFIVLSLAGILYFVYSLIKNTKKD